MKRARLPRALPSFYSDKIAAMVAVLLLMFVGGIALTQTVSDPHQVTLRWLRLGGIIALTLLAVAAVVLVTGGDKVSPTARWQPAGWPWSGLVAAAVLLIAQLMATQLGRRQAQRALALASSAAAMVVAWRMTSDVIFAQAIPDTLPLATEHPLANLAAIALGSGILGGFLMAMLLGHAYLTAGGEMTQTPFRRLVLLLGALMLARAGVSVAFGLWPYLQAEDIRAVDRLWNTVMMTARYLVGLLVPAVFTAMTYDCVQRRANQSATGILYVAGVLVIVGEGIALALLGATGLAF